MAEGWGKGWSQGRCLDELGESGVGHHPQLRKVKPDNDLEARWMHAEQLMDELSRGCVDGDDAAMTDVMSVDGDGDFV